MLLSNIWYQIFININNIALFLCELYFWGIAISRNVLCFIGWIRRRMWSHEKLKKQILYLVQNVFLLVGGRDI